MFCYLRTLLSNLHSDVTWLKQECKNTCKKLFTCSATCSQVGQLPVWRTAFSSLTEAVKIVLQASKLRNVNVAAHCPTFNLLHIFGTTSNQKWERTGFWFQSGGIYLSAGCLTLSQTASGTSSQHGDCGADLFGKGLWNLLMRNENV